MKLTFNLILCMFSTVIGMLFTSSNTNKPTKLAVQNEFNVKNFGAKGDGVTDDYNALVALAKAVNEKGGGNVFFPKGTYYIAQYHAKGDSIPDILFQNCNNLSIRGDQAIISTNGAIFRNADIIKAKAAYSTTNAIVPLSFYRCTNLKITNIELNGNVDKMKRDPRTKEGNGHLIKIMECENVLIENIYAHHAQTDGIYISGREAPSVNVTINNSTSSNNARQGMSICNLNIGRFNNCKFINTGITGQYGALAPASGVDIEPPIITKGIKTGNIVFDKCTFSNNVGAQFQSAIPKNTSNVRLVNCTISAGSSTSNHTMVLAADNIVVDSCNIDCGPGKGSVYARWGDKYGSNVEIKNSIIKSADRGIVATSKIDVEDQVNIHNNQLISTAKGSLKAYFPYFNIKNLTFNNNKIYIPSGALNGRKASSLINNAKASSNNTFYSDKVNIKPTVSYKGTQLVTDK